MGTKLIVQDDGKFGLWTTFSDQIYALDCSEEEIIQIWRERAAERAEQEMRDWIAEARGEKPGVPGSRMTLKEALKSHLFHGEPAEGLDGPEWVQFIKERKDEVLPRRRKPRDAD
jgi:hypothetical protein